MKYLKQSLCDDSDLVVLTHFLRKQLQKLLTQRQAIVLRVYVQNLEKKWLLSTTFDVNFSN